MESSTIHRMKRYQVSSSENDLEQIPSMIVVWIDDDQ